MRSSRLVLVLCVVGLGMLLATASAYADIVNVSTSTTLFADNFESQPNGQVSHAAYPDASHIPGDCKPTSANPGSWTVIEYDGSGYFGETHTVQVTDHAGAGDPGAYERDNYLRIVRENYVNAAKMDIAAQSTPNDVIHLETMVYVSAQEFLGVQIVGQMPNSYDSVFNVGTQADGTLASYSGGQWQTVSGLSYTPGVWQKWELDYAIGTSSVALSIDGTTVSGIPIVAAGGLQTVSFTKEANTSAMYLDAVPEPCTLAMLSAGLIGLLAYAWKSRR